MTTLVLAGIALAQLAPKADAPVAKLGFLVGEWKSVEKSMRRDGSSITFHLKGVNRWTLRGTALVLEEAFSIPGAGDMENHILMNFEPVSKKYQAFWFSSSSARPIEFVGEWETDKKLVFKGTGPQKLRIVYNLLRDGRYDAALQREEEGGKITDLTLAEYTRTNPPAAPIS